MSLTVSNQAQSLYNSYTFTNSGTYAENAVDPSAFSREKHRLSSLQNTLNALNGSASADVYAIGNVNRYARDMYTLSQLDSAVTLRNPSPLGGTGLDAIYNLIGYGNLLTEAQWESLIDASASGSYSDYMGENGGILDILA